MTQDGRPNHQKDEDCTLGVGDDPDSCIECGVWHGDPCPLCGGRGFHRPGCADSDETIAVLGGEA